MRFKPSRLVYAINALLLLLPCYLLVSMDPPKAVAAEGDIQMSYQDHLLTIKTQKADIKNILLRLSDATGVYVSFPKDIDKKVSVNLVDTPLAKALKKLLRGLNHAIIYSAFKKQQPARVAQVHVFNKSTASYTPGRPTVNPQRQNIIARRIENYEKRIQSLSERLAGVDANSAQGRRYTRQIESYKRALDRLKQNQR